MKRVTKFLAVTLIAFLSIFFMACNGEVPAEVLAAAKADLDIELATGDSTLSITGDITLPAALEEYEDLVITWSSNNTAAIQNDGTVIRSAVDVSVEITATLTYEEVTETKKFTVVVKADPALAVAAAKTALGITYATGDSLTSVTGNLTLPAFQGDVDVTWASGTPAVITNAGVVTRGAADVTVTMTATLTMGTTSDTKTFDVVVKANPTLAVAAAKAALAITYATGDSATSVSDDVTLPTTLNGVAIAWASDNAAVVSTVGNVSRTLEEETVVLTATLTMGTVTDTKTFTLTVLADTRLGVAMDALEDHYAATLGDPEYTVTADIVLIASIEGATVTWESKNTSYVSHTGVITRPSFTQGSQNVELVATVAIGGFEDTVSFFAYLEKLAKSDLELSNEILTRATAFPAAEGIASDLTLVATAKDDAGIDYPITWASDNPTVIALDGTVTQDKDNDITVTLTATVTLNEVPYTRSKTFKVFKESTALVVDSIVNAWKEDVGTYVKIMNLTVLAVYGTGNYIVTDGTSITQVYAVSNDFTVKIGSVYNITGVVDLYYGAPELKGDVTAKPFVFEEVTDATPEAAPLMVGTVEEVLADQPSGIISNNNPMVYKFYTVTGKVFVSQTLEGNYNTYIVSDDFTGTRNEETSIMIYYQSNIATVREFDGMEVTLDLMMLGYRSDFLVWYANFYGTADDIDAVELTGQAALDADVAWLTLPAEVESAEELTLPAAGPYESTIAWSVVSGADAGIIAAGKVTFPKFNVDTDVVLKATLTQPELTAVEKSFTIKVKREVIPALPGQELFFSEYIEGGGNNKALEIYNPSNVTIDLSTYVVEIYGNGSLTSTGSLSLSGFLAPGEVFVIGNPSATGVDPAIVAASDVTSTVTYFNGDDALVLKNGTLIVDSIGKIGEDPTSGFWGSSTTGSTLDWTMVRKATVRGGRTDALGEYDPASEWDFYAKDTVTYIGSHTMIEGDLIISEYIEGSSNNKALEIYNASNMTIDLSRYSVEYYNNGASAPTKTFVLTGTLAPGEVYVITTDTANAAIQAVADEVQLYADLDSVVFFNGDDTVVLRNGSLIIDSIGQVGVDPGSFWGASASGATAEYTMVRKANVRVGRTNATGEFDPAEEWNFYPVDTFTYIGSHTMNTSDLFFSEYIEGTSNHKALEIYNPTNAAIDLSRYSVEYYNNGAKEPTKIFLLSGSLAAGEVFVITTDTANAAIQAVADEVQLYADLDSVVFFNGDDALVLRNGSLIIDSIGQVGADPGDFWGTGDVTTKDHTLVRKANVTSGYVDINAIYNPADHWNSHPVDTFTSIGAHTVELADHAALAAADVTALTIDLAVDGLEVVTLPVTQGSSTIAWAFKEATTNATLVENVLTMANVESVQTIQLTATLTYTVIGVDPIVTTKDFTLTITPIVVVTDISTLNAKTGSAWTIANDTYVYVEGVVTGNYINYGSEAGTFIQDANGKAIYAYGLKGQTVGDKVIVYGKLGDYNSVRQLASSVLKKVVSSGNEIVVTQMTLVQIQAIQPTYYEYAGMVIEVEAGLIVKEYRSNGYMDIIWVDAATDYLFSIFYNSEAYSWLSTIYPATNALPKVQFTLYNIYSTYTFNITNLVVDRTADQDVILDAAKIPDTLTLTENFVIPASAFGSTYTVTAVSAELTAFIDYTTTPGTLIITQPAAVDAIGTVTVTVSKAGATDKTEVIAVTVKSSASAEENTPVIIYEAYGGGGNSGATYKNDFIVLYNTTDAAIDLSTYSIQYASGTGTTWTVTNLTGTIAAKGYYLIQQAAGTGGTVDLPTPNVIGTVAMSGTGFKLALVSSQTALTGTGIDNPNVVDYVGCGTATTFETAVAPAPSNTTSIKRTSFIDTDNNSVDFVAGAINLAYLTV